MTATETKWAERVRKWRESGKTATEFVQGQGYEASTLRYWASRLRHRPSSARPTVKRSEATPRVRLLRVRRAPAPPAAGEALVVVAIGAARLEVRAGFDRLLLRQVVDALGGAT